MKQRDRRLFTTVIDGLIEYYPELKKEKVVKEVQGRVPVINTSNDQRDYEGLRDWVTDILLVIGLEIECAINRITN